MVNESLSEYMCHLVYQFFYFYCYSTGKTFLGLVVLSYKPINSKIVSSNCAGRDRFNTNLIFIRFLSRSKAIYSTISLYHSSYMFVHQPYILFLRQTVIATCLNFAFVSVLGWVAFTYAKKLI